MWSTRWQNGWRRPRNWAPSLSISSRAIQSSGFSKFVKNIMEFSRAVVQAKKSCGVWTGAIDAVGYQARDDKNPSRENPTQALENALRVVNPTGSVGVIGVYICPDSGAKDEQRKQGIFSFPLANFFEKGLTIGTWARPGEEVQRVSPRLDRERALARKTRQDC